MRRGKGWKGGPVLERGRKWEAARRREGRLDRKLDEEGVG